jgi:hypothetical protein
LYAFLTHPMHVLYLSYLPWFDHPNNIWCRVQITKITNYKLILVSQFSPSSIFLSVRSN